MNSIWKKLPIELVYLICNKLPQVRGIPIDLKEDIISSSKFEEVRDVYVEYFGDLTRFDYECFKNVECRFVPSSRSKYGIDAFKCVELWMSTCSKSIIDMSTKDLWVKMSASEKNVLYTNSLLFKQELINGASNTEDAVGYYSDDE